jgi:hypothetical protein
MARKKSVRKPASFVLALYQIPNRDGKVCSADLNLFLSKAKEALGGLDDIQVTHLPAGEVDSWCGGEKFSSSEEDLCDKRRPVLYVLPGNKYGLNPERVVGVNYQEIGNQDPIINYFDKHREAFEKARAQPRS